MATNSSDEIIAGGKRWIQSESDALIEIRKRLHEKLTNRPQFPEVVGDRRLLRFLRGKQHKIDVAVEMISNFLDWRDKNKVDDIRQQIVYGGLDTPWKFPKAEIILKLMPQIVITGNSRDKHGRPLCMELYGFNPRELLKQVTEQEFVTFLIHALEYRAIVMEQLSEEKERLYLQEHLNPTDRIDGYGVIELFYSIRDVKNVGLQSITPETRTILGNAITIGEKNYAEYLGKNQITNVPWVFNTIWYFIKGFLDADTLAKINLCGNDYMTHLEGDMDIENIPTLMGGKFDLYNEPYYFNTQKDGPLWYEGCEKDAEPYLVQRDERLKSFLDQGKTEEYCYYWSGTTPVDSPYLYSPTESSRITKDGADGGDGSSSVSDSERLTPPPPPSESESEK